MADDFTRDRWSWLEKIGAGDRFSLATFKTAFHISRHINREKGDAWPSLDTLAASVGTTERTVRRSINELCAAGFLKKRRRGFSLSNRYEISFPDAELGSAPIQHTGVPTDASIPDTRVRNDTSISDTHVRNDTSISDTHVRNDGSIPDTRVRSFRTPVSGHSGHPCPPNTLTEPFEKEPIEEDISPLPPNGSVQQGTRQEDHSRAFDEFWQAYPLRKAKGAAKRAFDKAIKAGASAAEIIEGAKHYASERAGQDPRYTAHPTTWLNGERWTDERKPAQGVTIDQQGNVIDAARTFERPKARTKADEHEAMAYGAFGLRGRS